MNLNSEAIKKNDVEIAINNVSVVFKDNQGNDVKALDNIDFDIHKGEFISLLGPSGCGKTTLLRTIADLLEPTSGNVRVSNMTPKEIRLMQKFGIVFQNPVLFEWRTVKKNIELPLEIMGYSKKDRSDRADEMLEMVGLTKFADHYPQQLSGGMQQRVQISKALANNPSLLLLDEVTTGLDLSVQAKVLDLIRQIKARYGISILLVSHDLAVIRMLADRTVVMLDGKIIESGLTDQILEDPQHAYTQQLVHSLL